MKQYVLQSECMIPWFKKAVAWYAENGPKNMPVPATLPDCPLGQIEQTGRASWGAFYVRNKAFSYIDEGSAMITGISSHMLPLFAGVHQGFPTHILAKIIEHHDISPADFYALFIGRQGITQLFTSKDDIHTGLLELEIEAWKAFEMLGKVTAKDNISSYIQVAAMHTECKEAWPATQIEQMADEIKSGRSTMNDFEFDHRHNWCIDRMTQLPNGNFLDFMRRSGMFSRSAYRKEVILHTGWEDLCMEAGKSGWPALNVARQVLESCKTAPAEEQQVIREALLSMHLHGITDTPSPMSLYNILHHVFEGSELKDILGSVILKVNASIPMTDAENYQQYLSKNPHYFHDILLQGHKILSRACEEILRLEPQQIGYAHFMFFNTLGRMPLGQQHLSGFSPEALMLRLDHGLSDFLGNRDLSEDIAQRVVSGLSIAFRELSKYHTWDFSQLQACSSLTQLKLVQEGANLRKFPSMDKKHRGMLLEEGLGL